MNNKTKVLPVYRDGQLDMTYMPVPLTLMQATTAALKAKTQNLASGVVLQARMAVFDVIHGTNYRSIRNDLFADRREERFVSSIGLIRV